ncbi:MAG TPA: DnaA N-terminal domain-containing protein [Aggregatilinea sp.]|uniref:DnaA N-terminal domain-containing protein n=1 Tax=Aggregatilinea sp. TaxID=2806333 RepID=UPI002C06ECB9|nr:DnaA N-terminal domain-containing protein [Aggregatilinea sp.]HML22116.1 DnaA N-terminal domain-containing protein [Aggregatilinea sp.]
MIIGFHWEMREYLHELRADGPESSTRHDARLPVLMTLALHANHRLRCWPTTRLLCQETGFASAAVVEARNWLIAHKAILIVPNEKREGLETALPGRTFVYQLTGMIETSQGLRPYLTMSDETREQVTQELARLIINVSEIETLSDSDVSETKTLDDVNVLDSETLNPANVSQSETFKVSETESFGNRNQSSLKEELEVCTRSQGSKSEADPTDQIARSDSARNPSAAAAIQDETSIEIAIAESDDGPAPNILAQITREYESNIAAVTAASAAWLKDAAETYPVEWIVDAIRQAVVYNKRSLAYVRSILERKRREQDEITVRRDEYNQLIDDASHIAATRPTPPSKQAQPIGLDQVIGSRNMRVGDAWQALLGQLELQLNRATYDTWLKGSTPARYEDGVLWVRAKHPYAREWLEKHLQQLMDTSMANLVGAPMQIRFLSEEAA